MFSNAKKVARAPAVPKAKPGNEKPVETIPGLEEVAALDACYKAIKGLLDLKKDALKAIAMERLIERGIARKGKPDGLAFADGKYATGKASILKRSVVSPLTPDELELLAELVGEAKRDEEGNIIAVPGFAETVEKAPAVLAVNPDYVNDELLLKRIDKALSGVQGIPDDFIVQVAAETKMVVSDMATDAVFRLKPEAAETVFSIVANVSVGASYKDMVLAWDLVRPMLLEAEPDTKAAKAQLAKMLKASVAA